MSIRRAVEAQVKFTLDEYIPSPADGYTHQVVESLRLEDRPLPAVIIVAGTSTPALDSLPDSLGNFKIPMTVIVMSSLDETTVDKHSELSNLISRIMRMPTSRFENRVEGLHIYDITQGTIGQENEGRRMIAVLNFDMVVNYMPEAPL